MGVSDLIPYKNLLKISVKYLFFLPYKMLSVPFNKREERHAQTHPQGQIYKTASRQHRFRIYNREKQTEDRGSKENSNLG